MVRWFFAGFEYLREGGGLKVLLVLLKLVDEGEIEGNNNGEEE